MGLSARIAEAADIIGRRYLGPASAVWFARRNNPGPKLPAALNGTRNSDCHILTPNGLNALWRLYSLHQTDWESYFGLLCHELAPLVTVNDVQSWRQARTAPAKLADSPDGRGISAHAPRDVLLVQTIPVSVLVHTHAIKGTRPNGWRTSEMRPIQTRAERGPLAADHRRVQREKTLTRQALIARCNGNRRRLDWF